MNEHDDTTLRAALEAAEQPPAHGAGYRETLLTSLREDAARLPRSVTRDNRRPWFLRRDVLMAAAATVAVAAAVTVIALVGRETVREAVNPPSAEAAEVVAKARRSLASFETVRAELVWGQATVNWPFDSSNLTGPLTGEELRDQMSVQGSVELTQPRTVVITADGRWSWFNVPSGKIVQYDTTAADGTPTRIYVKPDFWTPPTRIEETVDWRTGSSRIYQPSYHWSPPDGTSSESAEYTAYDDVGYAPGPPDTYVEWRGPFPMPLAAWAALERGGVTDTTFEGRPTLTVTADVTPILMPTKGTDQATLYVQADSVALTVDAATGFPLRTVLYLKGDPVELYELRHLKLDGPVSPQDFTLEFPAGVDADRTDWGFREVTLSRAPALLGYSPFKLDQPPEGYGLERVTVAARTSWFCQVVTPDGVETRPLAFHDVFSLGYRRGFLHVTVTTRPTDGVDAAWLEYPFSDMALCGGSIEEPEAVQLTDGAFAGATAHLVLPPLGTPALWLEKNGLLVTVAGDLSRDELVRTAESLEPVD
jgi:hypothetical protein